ncbi:DUF4129 domain-containing transglutaminase family protein [Metabacillus arenae]|uniref:DUF4129 domain-containing protein n=1 Tax=Metabacillus arenae TaxID=2771434 RepID=A0A926NLX9_9BACI|nr:DUF4129 domain-containing transglutaminase family protein [Metabacillus arenae]MBD1383130.1 DUF4129 domain-containing protein [Metabacillus arenae]
MNYTKQKASDRRVSFYAYYLFAFLLLWEWLRPLESFTDTRQTSIFVFFIAISFLMTSLKTKWYIAVPVKIGFILFILHGLFFEGNLFSMTWVSMLFEEITYNFSFIQQARWMEMTDSFRTLLFFILLWLLVYLLHYWLIFQKRILFFFIMTLAYITILDTFSPYDATFAIVRIVIIGFFLLGLLYLDRLMKTEGLGSGKSTYMKWITPLFVFIAFATSLGFLSPKAAPQWPDPVPYFTAYGMEDEALRGNINKIGYGPNDEQLGGPFIEDPTLVFTAVTESRHYWRVEVKDEYTGKGWVSSKGNENPIPLDSNNIEVEWLENVNEDSVSTSSIEINPDYRFNHLMYPLGLNKVDFEEETELTFHPLTERIETNRDQSDYPRDPNQYEVEFTLPAYKINELEEAADSSEMPQELMRRYTQLPDSLPERVRDLAAEITKEETNQYDRVKAVERYFGSSSFVYETTDVAVPGENEDYVDQFLFETMKGYCDNFSTSMVVLLRSLDIPARWVKGYTNGDYVGTIDGSRSEYEVTNNNAHSWVEVYFPGAGWVPFEPTKGFSNPATFTTDFEGEQAENSEAETETEAEETEAPDKPEALEQNENELSRTDDNATLFQFSFGNPALYLTLLMIALCGGIIYFTRRKWQPILALIKFRNRKDPEIFFQAYPALLKEFERFGLKRQENQTLRDFAKYVDQSFNNEDMTTLTNSYERALYRRNNAAEEWKKSVELWENLIKKTSS